MKKDWAKGVLSSRQVQEYCAGASIEGCSSRAVQAFSRVGGAGAALQNAQRDLMRVLGRPLGTPNVYVAEIPTRNGNGERVQTQHSFLLPHEAFAQLHCERKDFFEQHVRGKLSEVGSCWDILGRNEFVKAHPVVSARGDLSRVLPLGMHGDAGSMFKHKGALVLTWNPLAGDGSSIQTRH